jgi:hypothetical protein
MRLVKAKDSLRKIESAERRYQSIHGKYGNLDQLGSEGLISTDLSKGAGDGYRFELRLNERGFAALAIPLKSMDSASPAYYLDQTGVLRQSLRSSEANANDEPAPET